MRRTFRGNRKEQRVLLEDAQLLRNEKLDIDAYYRVTEDEKVIAKIFVGNTAKPHTYSRFSSLARFEKRLQEIIDIKQSRLDYKEKNKLAKKERQDALKKALVPGATVRTSFSYNMTFNHFYRVVSSKRTIYTLEVLSSTWVDGDAGYTGSVKAGEETGKFVEGKLTASGLKIDNLYGDVINPDKSFYENHMD